MKEFYNSYNQNELDNDFISLLLKELSEVGFVDKSIIYKDGYDIYKIIDPIRLWTDISHFVYKQLKRDQPEDLSAEPILSGQISLYMGIYVAFLWKNDKDKLLTNVLKDERWEIDELSSALYNSFGVDFESPFQVELKDILAEAKDIQDVQKFFLSITNLEYDSEKEIEIRTKINQSFCQYIIKCSKVAKLYKPEKLASIYLDAMTLMYKIGYCIGTYKY